MKRVSCAEQFEAADDVLVVLSCLFLFCMHILSLCASSPPISAVHTVLQVSHNNNTMCTFPLGYSAETHEQNRSPELQVWVWYFIVIVSTVWFYLETGV